MTSAKSLARSAKHPIEFEGQRVKQVAQIHVSAYYLEAKGLDKYWAARVIAMRSEKGKKLLITMHWQAHAVPTL